MTSSSTYQKTKKHNKTSLQHFVMLAFLFMTTLSLHAQNVLVGLTSNGGIDGKGTAFSINTNGNNFSLIKGFTDWGTAPKGNLFKNDDGNFYGVTSEGGTNNYGTIFMLTPAGEITMLKQFSYYADGANPTGELVKGADGYLYGTTSSGGTNSYGTIFKISVSGDFSVIKHLSYTTDGAHPYGHLTLASDGNFYGITYNGGSTGAGTIFKLTPGGVYSVIHTLTLATEGANCYSSLTEGSDGNLYGTTYGGGQYSYGTVFKVTKGGTLTVIKQLNAADGTHPQSDIIEAKDGNFYGTCYNGGQFSTGVIFKITKAGVYSVVKNFSPSADGGYPYGGLMLDTDGSLYGITSYSGSKGGGTVYKFTTAGAYSVIHPIDYNTEGNTSYSALVKGNDGSLYAMTSAGGTYNFGTIFKTTTGGSFTVVANFNGAVLGNAPYSSFIKGKDSAYYCTTSAGGAYGYGSIVKICGGKATALFSFNKSANGAYPKGDLLLASDGNFYGMTSSGGTNGVGTIFKITSGGNLSVLRHFNGTADGANPYGSLIQGKDGFLYGMSSSGGSNNGGTIFKINISGSNFTVLKSFVFATDGGSPNGSLIQASDDNFYGMTTNTGRIFKLTPAGVYTNLHTFNSSSDGYVPMGSLIQDADGNLYGTCSDGGTNSSGTIFKMSLSGTFTTLRALNATPDGRMPKGTLLQGADGMLYGTTSIGGTYNTGTIFKVSTSGSSYTVLRHMNIVTDGGNAYGGLIFAPVNNYTADAKTATVNEDSSVKITLSGSGGASLTYTIVSNPAHGKLSGTAPNLTYKPDNNYSGSDNFKYTVGMGCITSAAAVVSITVKPMPDAPVLASIGNKTVVKNTTLKFKAKATDADAGQTIKYSLIGAPTGAKINQKSGAFSWTPTTAGSYSFKIRATDDDTPALYNEEQITITVINSFAEEAYKSENAAMAKTNIKVNVFPNPATNVLHIRLQVPVDDLSVKVIDMKGAIAGTYNFNNSSKTSFDVNVSKLSQGIYILQLQSGELKQTFKFMKN